MKSTLTISILWILSFSLYGQNDPFRAMDSTYNAQIESMNQHYESRLNRMDSLFYEYLQKDWELFPIHEGMESEGYETYDGIFTEKGVQSIIEPPIVDKQDKIEYIPIQFLFFGIHVTFQVDIESKIALLTLTETEITNKLIHLEGTDYISILNKINLIKQSLKLNDWGVLLLINQLSKQFFSDKNTNEQICFNSFLLTKSGYDVKLGRIGGKLFGLGGRLNLLLPLMPQVSLMNYITIDNKTYYLLENLIKEKDDGVHTYKLNYIYAKNNIDLSLSQPPLLGSKDEKRILSMPELHMGNVNWKKELISFYDTYPQTNLSVYLHVGLSKELKQSLLSAFHITVGMKDKLKACQTLLSWFCSRFPYKTDEEQYGFQRIFFPEQSFHYPYTDCEDRAILFAHLVKEITGLDVVLLAYPKKHVATGICFDKKPEGHSVSYKNKEYTICDPTYINAPIGSVMPEIKSITPIIIPVK